MGTIIRAVVAYLVLLALFRIIGRRAVDHMTPFEMIVIFLVGGMMIQAVVSDDRSITNGILAVMTIGLMHVTVAWLKDRSDRFGRIADGTPVVVLGRGEWHPERMRKLRIHQQDVLAAARQNGLEREEQVKYAIVERNGAISIVKAEHEERPGDGGDGA